MRFTLLSPALLFLFIQNAHANTPTPIRITSIVNDVTVFLHGAEIHATAQAQIGAGNYDIIVENLPTDIIDKTIQVSGTGDLTILSVQYTFNFLKTKVQEQEVKRLEDSLEMVNLEITKQQTAKSILDGMVKILDANNVVSGSNTGLNPDTYTKTLDIYYARMTKIKDDELVIDETIKKLRTLQTKLTEQLKPYTTDNPTGEITISVNCHIATRANLQISYVVTDAGWAPEYDIRCESTAKPISLTYKALVFQNTGTTWNNVKLTVSTGNPDESAGAPNLLPRYLDFYAPVVMQDARMSNTISTNGARGYTQSEKEVVSEETNQRPVNSAADYTTVTQSAVSVEFSISQPYTIPADNTPHTVTVQENDIPAQYYYKAVPKLDKDAFLVADITGWGVLNLLPGNANIFYQGSYVGQSVIDSRNTNDTMNLSLGRDKSIVVKRIAVQNNTSTAFIGSNVRKSYAWDIIVKNTRMQDLDIKVYDQLPISNNNDIVVYDADAGNGKIDATTKLVEWDLHIKGNEEQKVHITYSIKYPKGKQVYGL